MDNESALLELLTELAYVAGYDVCGGLWDAERADALDKCAPGIVAILSDLFFGIGMERVH